MHFLIVSGTCRRSHYHPVLCKIKVTKAVADGKFAWVQIAWSFLSNRSPLRMTVRFSTKYNTHPPPFRLNLSARKKRRLPISIWKSETELSRCDSVNYWENVRNFKIFNRWFPQAPSDSLKLSSASEGSTRSSEGPIYKSLSTPPWFSKDQDIYIDKGALLGIKHNHK